MVAAAVAALMACLKNDKLNGARAIFKSEKEMSVYERFKGFRLREESSLETGHTLM